jgi:hypothetical protein
MPDGVWCVIEFRCHLHFALAIRNADAAIISAGQEIWCQRRDSNSQTPVSKTGCYSNSHTLALWCTGEDLNLRVPLGETGLQPVRFGLAHAPVQSLAESRRIERPSLITMPRFSGPVAGHSAVPSAWRRVRELNPLASCERPCLADKCLTVRPTLR